MMRSPIRALAFVRKEVVDVVRQPLLVLALIVGPFLILFAFGAGLRDTDPPLRTAFVVGSDAETREQVEEFAETQHEAERLVVVGVTEDEAAARSDLRDRDIDLIIVVPDEVSEEIQEEEQAVIEIYHNQIDPVESQAIALFTRSAVADLNDRVLEDILGDLQEQLREFDGGQDEDYLELEPAVLVSPFRGDTQLLGGGSIALADFYAPAVVVVLLQHVAVTLLGLSVVRERSLGASELFRVSPLRTSEYLAGKFLAYLLLGAVVGAALVALLVFGLGTPMRGEWWALSVGLGVLMFTSTALGLVVALLANSDSQAVQYSMLVLLATIFLSGFLLSLERFIPAARPVALLLPASYGIELVRDVMLRGTSLQTGLVVGLAAYGVVFALLGGFLAHRRVIRPGL